MYDPWTISTYGQAKQQDLLRDAEAYWHAQLVRESRGQSSVFDQPHRPSPLRRVAHLVTALIR